MFIGASRFVRKTSISVENEIALRSVYANLPSIETGRLRLRKLQIEDAADMFDYASDPEVTRFRSWRTHLSTDDSMRFIVAAREKYSQGDLADWGIELRSSNTLIGTIGFQCVRSGYIADLGFTIGSKVFHSEIALEAVESVLEFGFVHLGFHRIQSLTLVDDTSSLQVLEAAGFTCEGVMRDFHYQKGRFVSVCMQALLRQDYHR